MRHPQYYFKENRFEDKDPDITSYQLAFSKVRGWREHSSLDGVLRDTKKSFGSEKKMLPNR